MHIYLERTQVEAQQEAGHCLWIVVLRQSRLTRRRPDDPLDGGFCLRNVRVGAQHAAPT